MRYFVVTLGFLFFAVGAIALLAIKSDIQIIIAVLAFGFGAACFGLFGIIDYLKSIHDCVFALYARFAVTSSDRPETSA